LALCFSSYSNAQEVAPVTTQTHIISDDGYAGVPLQFNFPYYGQSFNQSWMFSNGIVSFQNPEQSGLSWANLSIQQLSSGMGSQFNYSIFPLWSDLINIGGTFQTEGSTQFQRYKWIGISPFYDPNRLNTFSVEIRPDGKVIANYSLVSVDYGQVGLTGNTSIGEFENIRSLSPGTTSIPNWERTPQAVDMCSINPLSSPSCPNYAQAYFDQQCSMNPLYNPTCPGYQQAYFTQQCSSNPLYDQSCPGYQQAYFTQQCSANQLYSPQCPGYAQAKALKDLQEQQLAQSQTVEVTPIVTSTTSTSSTPTITESLKDPTKTETVVTTDVGGVELTTTGQISVPTGQTAATKEAIKESVATEEKKTEEKKKVDPKALAVARAAVAETERTALTVSEAAVALSQSESVTGSGLNLGTGITLQGFRPIGVQSDNENNRETTTTQQRQNNTLELQNRGSVASQGQDTQMQTGSSVKNGGKVEGLEGGPDPTQLARAPMDFNQYLNMQMRDSQFYSVREIYKGQQNVDNARVLRGLSGGSDRLHQEMIQQQYR